MLLLSTLAEMKAKKNMLFKKAIKTLLFLELIVVIGDGLVGEGKGLNLP